MILEIHIHPILVHFPIASIYLVLFFEVLSLMKSNNTSFYETSYYLTIIATIGAVLSQLSGLFLTKHPEYGPIKEVFEQHELWALISVILLLLTSSFKTFVFFKSNNKKFRILSLILVLLCVTSITYTGHLGGMLVFNYLIK